MSAAFSFDSRLVQSGADSAETPAFAPKSDLEETLCRGRAEGKAQGKIEGKAEGELAPSSALLQRLLSNPLTAYLPDQEKAKLSGLSVAKVEQMRGKQR
jgi:predicted transposase YdaD